jgi:hypothetical protein
MVWLALLAAAALATYAYVATGDVRGRELSFVAVVLLLSAFSGVTTLMIANAVGWKAASGPSRTSPQSARPTGATPKNAQAWVAAPEAPVASRASTEAPGIGPVARRAARLPRPADGTP